MPAFCYPWIGVGYSNLIFKITEITQLYHINTRIKCTCDCVWFCRHLEPATQNRFCCQARLVVVMPTEALALHNMCRLQDTMLLNPFCPLPLFLSIYLSRSLSLSLILSLFLSLLSLFFLCYNISLSHCFPFSPKLRRKTTYLYFLFFLPAIIK